MNIAIIFILALTVEALVEYGKIIFTARINWTQVAAILIAVLLAIAASTDLYALLGVSFNIPYLGCILTGIVFSRGANYLADFIKMAQMYTLDKQLDYEEEE